MPTFVAPARFTDATAALEQVKSIYQGGLAHLRESMLRFVAGEALPGRVRACYPFVRVRDLFDVPDLDGTDDRSPTARSNRRRRAEAAGAFTAQRIDYSLHRCRTIRRRAQHFQNFVLFTNYQFYIDEFCARARKLMAEGGAGYVAFVEPGNVITPAGSDREPVKASRRRDCRKCRPTT
jgi:hypothetical protein